MLSAPTTQNLGYPYAVINDGKGGNLLCFHEVTQAHMDLLQRRFIPRPDDVYVVTYPRSGTTWMRQLVHLLLHGGEQGAKGVTQTVPYLVEAGDHALPHLICLQKWQGRRYLATHQTLALIPGRQQPQTRYIYVARNPKDCAVSYYHFALSTKLFSYQGSWDHFCDLFAQGLVPWGAQIDHVCEWWQASRGANTSIQGQILFVKYEEMQKNLATVVDRIAHFLEVDISSAIRQRVIAQADFAAMRENPKTAMPDWPRHAERFSPHLRKGVVGDWRHYFSPAQNALYDQLYQTRMVAQGLAFDFDL